MSPPGAHPFSIFPLSGKITNDNGIKYINELFSNSTKMFRAEAGFHRLQLMIWIDKNILFISPHYKINILQKTNNKQKISSLEGKFHYH